jgi:hypothetical protein
MSKAPPTPLLAPTSRRTPSCPPGTTLTAQVSLGVLALFLGCLRAGLAVCWVEPLLVVEAPLPLMPPGAAGDDRAGQLLPSPVRACWHGSSAERAPALRGQLWAWHCMAGLQRHLSFKPSPLVHGRLFLCPPPFCPHRRCVRLRVISLCPFPSCLLPAAACSEHMACSPCASHPFCEWEGKDCAKRTPGSAGVKNSNDCKK